MEITLAPLLLSDPLGDTTWLYNFLRSNVSCRASVIYIPVVCIQVPGLFKEDYLRNRLVNTAYNTALDEFHALLNAQGKVTYNDEFAKTEFIRLFNYQISLTVNTSITFGVCLNITPISYPKYSAINEYPH